MVLEYLKKDPLIDEVTTALCHQNIDKTRTDVIRRVLSL